MHKSIKLLILRIYFFILNSQCNFRCLFQFGTRTQLLIVDNSSSCIELLLRLMQTTADRFFFSVSGVVYSDVDVY